MRARVEGVSQTFRDRHGREVQVVLPSALPLMLAGYRLGAGGRSCSWCRRR